MRRKFLELAVAALGLCLVGSDAAEGANSPGGATAGGSQPGSGVGSPPEIIVTEGVVMHLHGIGSFGAHAERVFSSKYREHVDGYYLNEGDDVKVSIEITKVHVKHVSRRLGDGDPETAQKTREGKGVAVVTFTQTTEGDLPQGITIEEFIRQPFNKNTDRDVFVLSLLEHKTFEGLGRVSHLEVMPPAGSGSPGPVVGPTDGNATTDGNVTTDGNATTSGVNAATEKATSASNKGPGLSVGVIALVVAIVFMALLFSGGCFLRKKGRVSALVGHTAEDGLKLSWKEYDREDMINKRREASDLASYVLKDSLERSRKEFETGCSNEEQGQSQAPLQSVYL